MEDEGLSAASATTESVTTSTGDLRAFTAVVEMGCQSRLFTITVRRRSGNHPDNAIRLMGLKSLVRTRPTGARRTSDSTMSGKPFAKPMEMAPPKE